MVLLEAGIVRDVVRNWPRDVRNAAIWRREGRGERRKTLPPNSKTESNARILTRRRDLVSVLRWSRGASFSLIERNLFFFFFLPRQICQKSALMAPTRFG